MWYWFVLLYVICGDSVCALGVRSRTTYDGRADYLFTVCSMQSLVIVFMMYLWRHVRSNRCFQKYTFAYHVSHYIISPVLSFIMDEVGGSIS